MNLIETPHDVVVELNRIRSESERGIGLLAEAEEELVRLQLAAERMQHSALLDSKGTVADREAISRLHATEAIEAAELQKVRVNYIKTKLKHLTEATMAVQTSARMIELQWKTSGVGH
jgi:hypothetical protein